MNPLIIQQARESYAIDDWSAGYFGINPAGNVECYPTKDKTKSIEMANLVEKLKKSDGISTPLILRFPQIVHGQIATMHEAFAKAMQDNEYQGSHLGVFPFKVNQRREFIDSIVQSGKSFSYGLEVGSKTEFIAALSYKLSPNALMICNGFKDKEYIRLCFVAKAMGKNITVVIEGPDELEIFLALMKSEPDLAKFCPQIGLRVRLYSRSSGKWEKSSGDGSKFGLSTNETLHCLRMLKENDMVGTLSMLHFHNGSQITQIRRIKNAIKEGSRIYAKVVKMGFAPKYLNIGGGIGVDYDGSKSSAQSSANYSLNEFASDAVYNILQVCEDEDVPRPIIVTESGRVIAAYHSVVITDIREVQSPGEDPIPYEVEAGEKMPSILVEFEEAHKELSQKNYVEYYHDAVAFQEEMHTLFNLGQIDLRQRAYGERLFYSICQKAVVCSLREKHQPEEFRQLQKAMVTKYLANFSMFQSIPDAWSIDQLFPVMPLSRHDEVPSHKATIVDITCDSDGCLDRFIDQKSVKDVLDLHTPDGKPYYIGFFLVGAYQESLANEHNLFGAIHEAEVRLDEAGVSCEKITEGDPISELLMCRNFSAEEMRKSYKKQLAAGELSAAENERIMGIIRNSFEGYPYLST